MVQSSRPSIQIDLSEFKLHLHLKSRTQLTLHFNSPSRRFYLSVIALVVSEMKKLGKIKSIPLQGHLDLLALLNESIGGTAGSSDKENLLHRIYTKWKDALPNLEEAPLFKVLGRKKEEGDGAIGKIYPFTDVERDEWANLFEYMGSDENVRLKFAIDKIGVGLNETSIIFGDSRNGEGWEQFISSLKSGTVEVASVDRMKYPLPDRPSIAVLPFVNMSGDPKQEYFSDGMTEDLITDLSKISGLMVIARNSTFPYKGKPVTIKQVAEELGVRYILEGSVRRAGHEIRINAQLVDAVGGHHLWAERYDGIIGKIFALQDQITQKIVSALTVKLTGSEKQIIAEKGTNNVEAYEEFLRGCLHYRRMTPDDLAKAVRSFKKAIELDPNYGRAYAALALAYRTGTFLPGRARGFEVS
jgi:TolB-like protein